jgi:putative spermidine/putrescine transport system ATP-binding protein
MTSAAPATQATADLRSITPAVELRGLGKRFGQVTALNDVSLSVAPGELVSLLGASGSGKSTLLRLIAGFDVPTSGSVVLGGVDVSRLSPAQRDIGMVFQNYALFPHLTVRRNIEYGLKVRRWDSARRAERVTEMLTRMRLEAFGERLPSELSGGQQQRVAIARALAFSPKLLLMDEPLGALDKALKENLLEEIRRVHREFGTTILYVTHDREEALVLSDRIALMDAAELQVCAPVEELFRTPPTAFAARFIAGSNVFTLDGSPFGLVSEGAGRGTVSVAGRTLEFPSVAAPGALAVRPAGFTLTAIDSAVLSGTVVETLFLGDTVRLRVTLDGSRQEIVVVLPDAAATAIDVGATVGLDILPSAGALVAL